MSSLQPATAPPLPGASAPRERLAPNQTLTRFCWFVVFYTVLVILWGALVRATGSGAGCGNHWPLCNGQVIPVSPGTHTVIEFTHRMMTGGSTLLVLALLIWTLRSAVRGQAARGFAIASTVLLFNEALLGALLVKLDYVVNNQSVGRMVLLSIHLSNTLLLVAALALTAQMLFTGQRWSDLKNARVTGLAVAGLVATIAVGVSGSLAALGDTLYGARSLAEAFAQDFAATSPGLLKLRLVHPVCAAVAAAFVFFLVRSSRADGDPFGTSRLGSAVVWLLGVQFALGIADVLLLAPAWMQILHLLGADLFWVALVVLAARTVWPQNPAGDRHRVNYDIGAV